MQNIDKITIIAVAVAVLGLCAYPTFLSGGKDFSEAISESRDTIDKKGQIPVPPETPPNLVASLTAEYEQRPASAAAEWSFYRRPAAVESQEVIVHEAGTHEAPVLLAVCGERDKDLRRAIHLIRGRAGDSKRVKGLKIAVEGQAGEGEWANVGEVAVGPGEEFEFRVEDAEIGVDHRYRLRSEAMSATPVELPEDQRTLWSSESDSNPMPPNQTIQVRSAQPGRVGANGDWQPGRAVIIVRTYDYDKDEVVKEQGSYKEPGLNQDVKTMPVIKGTNYRLQRITGTGTKLEVQLVNVDDRRDKPKMKNNNTPRALDVEKWENTNLGGDDDESGDDGEQASEPEPEPEPDKKPRRSGGLFGDDD